jgi:hypothetical protein
MVVIIKHLAEMIFWQDTSYLKHNMADLSSYTFVTTICQLPPLTEYSRLDKSQWVGICFKFIPSNGRLTFSVV